MSAVFESIAAPKWGYESTVPVPLTRGHAVASWLHGLGAAPTEIYAFLKSKIWMYGYFPGEIIPLELNRDGDGARNHTFSATSTEIIFTQGDPIYLTRKNNRIHTVGLSAHDAANFELFVKASL